MANVVLSKLIAFVPNHQDNMHYKTCWEQGPFFNFGVVEGGCK